MSLIKWYWTPSQPTATRPLAIQKAGTWFTYGYDITKNICEVFGQHGYILHCSRLYILSRRHAFTSRNL